MKKFLAEVVEKMPLALKVFNLGMLVSCTLLGWNNETVVAGLAIGLIIDSIVSFLVLMVLEFGE